jgi:uncharacterized membrane protein YfcA
MMEWNLQPLFIFLICLISTSGAVLQGSIGLGLGFIAVPLLALINPDFIPGPLLMAAIVLTILISFREQKAIQFKGIIWVIGGRVIGSILGVILLSIIPSDYLSILFASMVILGVILSFSGIRLKLNIKNLLSAGTISGLSATTSAIGGPPMALIYQYLKGPQLRGTLSGIFLIGGLISLIMLYTIGRFGLYEIQLSLLLLPGIFIGYALSKYTAKLFDRGFIRPAVLTFSLLSGLTVILKTLI